MKRGFLVPLLLAILAAIVYTVIVTRTDRKLRGSQSTKAVFVPTRDIKEREVIKREFIQTKQIPIAYLQKDAFTYNTDADFKAIENAVARVQIPKGNQISKYAITSLSPEAGLSSKIPVEMRGFIINNIPVSTASLIKPDDAVDILFTFPARLKGDIQQNVTVTLLQNIKVLGVGADLGQGLDAKSAGAMKNKEEDVAGLTDSMALALALSPTDAQYLALAQQEGTITVVLRSHGDGSNYRIQVATFDKLFN